MKKHFKFSWGIFLILMILTSALNVKAAGEDFIEVPIEEIEIKASSRNKINTFTDSQGSLDACDLGIGINKNGLGISYATRTTEIASEIGIKDLVLQEKTLLGWKDIPIKDRCDYDTDFYMGSVIYLKAEINKTYRVYCTHYAIINEQEYTLYNITDSIVYNN